MLIWLNGQFLDSAAAKISVFDAGFQHGVGLFETMLARNGRIFRIEAHMHRLAGSSRELRLTERLRTDPLAEAAELVVQRNEMESARVRLTVTGGDLNLLQSAGRTQQDPTILIVAQPPTPYPDAFFEKGVTAVIADARSNPLSPMAGHKTLNYWPRIQALQQAAGRGAGEALWFTVSNHLASGSVSNVFLVRDGELLTPIARGEEEGGALPAPVLPGITRGVIIELADDLGIATHRRTLGINEVLGADEVFLTNSSWGVLPVIGLERESIADGAVGTLTQQLRTAWRETVERETGE
jgi:branched-subunit amino acid aminotransferase/4-amino-4-deoxychorismate lyase